MFTPNGVTRRIKAYGIKTPPKSGGGRRYKDVKLRTLFRVQRNYGIDLGIKEEEVGLPPAENVPSGDIPAHHTPGNVPNVPNVPAEPDTEEESSISPFKS